MKILCLTTVFPLPLDAGGRVRMLGLLRALAAEHRVHLLTLAAPDAPLDDLAARLGPDAMVEAFPPLPQGARTASGRALRWARALAAGVPTWCAAGLSPEMRRRAHDLARHADRLVVLDDRALVYLDELVSPPATVFDCQYVRGGRAGEPGATRALDAVQVVLDRRLVRRFLRRHLAAVDTIVVTSAEEARNLEDLYGRRADAVVPSAVDVPHQPASPCDDATVVCVGDMGWGPNVEGLTRFLAQAWGPLGRQGARLLVAGRDAPPALRRLAEASSGVSLLGYVPDLAALLDRAAVSVAPVWSGGGVRLKTLTMLAAGLPLVATPAALEGIAAEPGRHCLVAPAPEDFTAAVGRLLADRALRRRLGDEGRALVAQHYSWKAVGPRFVEAVEGTARSPEPAR